MKFPKINFRKMWAFRWQSIALNIEALNKMTDGEGDISEHNKVDVINQIEAIKGHLSKLQEYVVEHQKQPREKSGR